MAIPKDELLASLRRENAGLSREIAALFRENAALTTELASLRGSGVLQSSLARAFQLERERLAAEAAAARYHHDQRTLWLRSADCLQLLLPLVAFAGHPAWALASLTRAYRGDAQLWGCLKGRRGSKGRTPLMACCHTGDLARVRWLVSLGADVHAEAEGGLTCLELAYKAGHLGIVHELQGHGVNLRFKTSSMPPMTP